MSTKKLESNQVVGKIYPIFKSDNDSVKSCPYCKEAYVYQHTCKKAKRIITSYSQFGQKFTTMIYSHCMHCDYGIGKCIENHLTPCTFENCDEGNQTEGREFDYLPVLTVRGNGN